MSEQSILEDTPEGMFQRADALRVLELALYSRGLDGTQAPGVLRDIEEGGYTLRLTTYEERLWRNHHGGSE